MLNVFTCNFVKIKLNIDAYGHHERPTYYLGGQFGIWETLKMIVWPWLQAITDMQDLDQLKNYKYVVVQVFLPARLNEMVQVLLLVTHFSW